jgi:hypothetical protein
MDPRAIKPSPSLTFLPVGTGKGKDKTGGGRDAVLSWIEKLDAPPLAELFRGVIDRDLANLESPRVAVLRRYSIENYLLDPLVIYGVLSDEGSAPAIDGVAIAQGQEHLIRGLPPASLQAIVDTIGGAIGQKLGLSTQSDTMPLPVSFTNGVALTYPAWMINRRGHDLLPLSQATFGGPGVLSPPRLLRSFRRVRMIPTELADLLHGLQSQLAVTVPKKPVDESEHGEASGMQRPGNGSTGSSTTQTANS